MIKFLRFEDGNLLNVNEIREITKIVNLNIRYEKSTLINVGEIKDITKIVNPNSRRWEGAEREIKATIEINTNYGRRTLFCVYASAPMKEGESWNYGTGGGSRAYRKIDDILDTMVVLLVDKMNDEDEKIIDIDTRFLEDAMQEEMDRG